MPDTFTKISNRVFADYHRQPRVPPPFAGVDVTGMPRDLLTAETNAFRRLSPRRNRWPELAALDARVAELEARQADASERLRDLREQLANAPRRDADALATWEVGSRKGHRPPATSDGIERQIADAEAEIAGLDAAVGVVLAEKAAFVETHRSRLVRDADKATAEAHDRVLQIVDELEQARATLVDMRQAATWAALYPGEAAARGPRENILVGGLAKPTKDALGIDIQIETARLMDLLRADADYWRRGATPEQRAAMGADAGRPADPQRAAVWNATPEGQEAERAERKAALKRHEDLWGPSGDAA